ncbi:MAG: lysophospholipid acyltransferase family protein [Salinarimonas sp.]
MSLLKRIGRHPRVRAAAGFAFARYLGLVARTNRFTMEPTDAHERVGPLMPVIAAMWHGQHFLVHLARRPQDPTACLVSRSGDGELNAIALEHLGVRPIRGSGDRGRGRVREKGGAQALRAMVRALEGGESVVMTADVPKIARRAGEGIVTLARLSGRPIVPVAVVTSRRKVFDSWDRAALALPFGRGAIVIGEPIRVARDAGHEAIETARRAVEAGLDDVHARAYARIGAHDPGADLRALPSGGGA